MGSWWRVEVGHREVPIGGKNYVPDALMMLFADDDLFVDGPSIDLLDGHESSKLAIVSQTEWHEGIRSHHLFHYTAPAGTIRSRLELQGFDTAWVRKLATAFVEESFDNEDPFEYWPSGVHSYPKAASVIGALTSRRGLSIVTGSRCAVPSSEFQFLASWWEQLCEAFDDPRFALTLALARTRAATPVTVDLSDLLLGGWLEPAELPHQAARSRLSTAISADGPVIVIVEGSSDSYWLKRSLELATPDVSHCFEFLDFHQHNPPGGTDRVVSLTKGMAAAGVMNRVVAVLDNDTAGQVAARQLLDSNLPERFAVVTLPDVAHARNYPTLGPEGQRLNNVNGRAVSIEFMFGAQVLRSDDGSCFPVRWHSFIDKAGAYQGRLSSAHKRLAHGKIESALNEKDSQSIPSEIFQGCRTLSEMLLNAARLRERLPASEASVLTATWARDPFVELKMGE